MAGGILDGAYEYDSVLFDASAWLEPAKLTPFVDGFLKQLAQAGRQVADRQQRSCLRRLMIWWARFIEKQTGKFPEVWLLAADHSNKNHRATARDLLRGWKTQIDRLHKIEQQAAASPAGNRDAAGRPTGELVPLDTRGLLRHQDAIVQPWPQIDRLLQNGEVDKALVKLAGIGGCEDEATALTAMLQFSQDQFKLGKSTRQQVEEQKATIAAAVRRALDKALPLS